jgi:hypothetical protein
MENRTGYQVTSLMVRSVHAVARYTKTHIEYNILISGKPLVPEVPDIADVTVVAKSYIITKQ